MRLLNIRFILSSSPGSSRGGSRRDNLSPGPRGLGGPHKVRYSPVICQPHSKGASFRSFVPGPPDLSVALFIPCLYKMDIAFESDLLIYSVDWNSFYRIAKSNT